MAFKTLCFSPINADKRACLWDQDETFSLYSCFVFTSAKEVMFYLQLACVFVSIDRRGTQLIFGHILSTERKSTFLFYIWFGGGWCICSYKYNNNTGNCYRAPIVFIWMLYLRLVANSLLLGLKTAACRGRELHCKSSEGELKHKNWKTGIKSTRKMLKHGAEGW